MSAAFQRRAFRPGEPIFRKGEAGDCLYFVERGRVRIWSGPEDDPLVFGCAGEGAVFGEMAILDKKPRMANASADEETVVLEMPASAVREAMHEADPMLNRLIHGLLGYIRALAGQVAEDAAKAKATGAAAADD